MPTRFFDHLQGLFLTMSHDFRLVAGHCAAAACNKPNSMAKNGRFLVSDATTSPVIKKKALYFHFPIGTVSTFLKKILHCPRKRSNHYNDYGIPRQSFSQKIH
jgi:hypothetical protein